MTPRSLKTPVTNPQQLETLVKVGFANRRKMLRNNLKNIIDGDSLIFFLEQLNINPEARAEELSLEQWIILSNNWLHSTGITKQLFIRKYVNNYRKNKTTRHYW